MSFRCRPKSLLLRRTSSCSSLPLNYRKSKDWAVNDGAPPGNGDFLPNVGGAKGPVPVIKLEPLREGGVEHISVIEDPDPPCHFCREQTSKPVHEDCTRLKIVSRGVLVICCTQQKLSTECRCAQY